MEAQGETRPRARAPITLVICIFAAVATVAWQIAPESIGPMWTNTGRMFYQPWRLLTSIFPHVSLFHLAFNVYWTWRFGSLLESRLGAKHYLALVLLLALVSSGAEQAFSKPAAGLSGVGYGFFGLLWVLSNRDARYSGVVSPTTVALFVVWFFACIASTVLNFLPIANVAHGVGATAGAIIGFAVTSQSSTTRHRLFGVIGATAIAIVVAGVFGQKLVNRKAYAADLAYRGYEALGKNDCARAASLLKESSEVDPTVTSTWVNLGTAYSKLDRLKESLIAYESVPASERDNPLVRDSRIGILNAIGVQKHEEEDYKSALGYFRRALELDTTSAIGHFNVANALAILDRFEEALEEVNAALALDPNCPGAKALRSEINQWIEATKDSD